MFLETLFTANHGPVMGYKEDGRKICPIIKNDEIELEVYQKMKVYLENLYENYKQLIQDIWNSNTSIREIEKEIKKATETPKVTESNKEKESPKAPVVSSETPKSGDNTNVIVLGFITIISIVTMLLSKFFANKSKRY